MACGPQPDDCSLTHSWHSGGISSGLIPPLEPAADIIHTIGRDAEDLLRTGAG